MRSAETLEDILMDGGVDRPERGNEEWRRRELNFLMLEMCGPLGALGYVPTPLKSATLIHEPQATPRCERDQLSLPKTARVDRKVTKEAPGAV